MPTIVLDPEKVNEALLFVQDLLERSPIEFFLLKNTAKQVYDNHAGLMPQLQLDCIDIGITRPHFTQDGQRMFKTLLDMYKVEYDWRPQGIRLMVKDVPVDIKIINRNYGFFKNPNRVFYRTVELNVPNPIDKYLKAQFIIR